MGQGDGFELCRQPRLLPQPAPLHAEQELHNYFAGNPPRYGAQAIRDNHRPWEYGRGDRGDYQSDPSEPKPRLPTFDGKGDWKAFWVKFQFLADRYDWTERKRLGHLVSCLYDEAMTYVSRLPIHIRTNLDSLVQSLDSRFGDHVLPETHRASLSTLRKKSEETMQEYAARIHLVMGKAYPGLEGTDLFIRMTIEHLLGGLPDGNLAYDVLTKRPQTVQQALDMIAWHESCRGGNRKKATVRQVVDADAEIRRTGSHRYVSEERLQHFGRDLKESLLHSVKEAVSESVKGLILRNEEPKKEHANWRRAGAQSGARDTRSKGVCYYCQKPGHFQRDCWAKQVDKDGMATHSASGSQNPGKDDLNK